MHQILMDIIRDTRRINSLESPRQSLHELRVIKSPAEVNLMRETCRIGGLALKKTMMRSRELETEGQVLASLEFESRMAGASHLAYPPVVASANNATIIHYISATSQLSPGDLVLVDAGCEYHGYSSDITRSYVSDDAPATLKALLTSSNTWSVSLLLARCTSATANE